MGNFILDFYCASERLAIELDGEVHNNEEAMRYDEKRTAYLATLNIRVLRFENFRVFDDFHDVLEEIRENFLN